MTAFTYANPFVLPLTLLIPLFLSDLSFAAVYNVSGNSPRWAMGNGPPAVADVTAFDPTCGVVLQFLPSETAALFFQGTSLRVYVGTGIPGPIDGGGFIPGQLYVWVDGKTGIIGASGASCDGGMYTWTDLDPQMTHNLTIAVLGPGSGPGKKLPAFWIKQASIDGEEPIATPLPSSSSSSSTIKNSRTIDPSSTSTDILSSSSPSESTPASRTLTVNSTASQQPPSRTPPPNSPQKPHMPLRPGAIVAILLIGLSFVGAPVAFFTIRRRRWRRAEGQPRALPIPHVQSPSQSNPTYPWQEKLGRTTKPRLLVDPSARPSSRVEALSRENAELRGALATLQTEIQGLRPDDMGTLPAYDSHHSLQF